MNRQLLSRLIAFSPVFVISLGGFCFFRMLSDSKTVESYLYERTPSEDLAIYSVVFTFGVTAGYFSGVYFSKKG